MRKKIFAMITVLVMVLSILPISVLAEQVKEATLNEQELVTEEKTLLNEEKSLTEEKTQELTTLEVAQPFSKDIFNMTVKANAEQGLDADVVTDFEATDATNYTATIILPKDAKIQNLRFSWDADIQVTKGDTAYDSGELPVPSAGRTQTYTVKTDSETVNYAVTTHQHNYKTIIKKATCQAAGEKYQECTVCGDKINSEVLEINPDNHVYEDGKCKYCQTGDIHPCFSKEVSLQEGNLLLILGGTTKYHFTFANTGKNKWTIQDKSGIYLGFSNNSFDYSFSGYEWKWDGSAFTATGTKSSSSSLWERLFGKVTYYLVSDGDSFKVSTDSTGSTATFKQDNKNHTYGEWHQSGTNQHCRTCTVCSHTEYEDCVYDKNNPCDVCGRSASINLLEDIDMFAEVYITSETTTTYPDTFWGSIKKFLGLPGTTVTTYTAQVIPRGVNIYGVSVYYSTDNGKSWKYGRVFSSNSNITNFLFCIEDNEGKEWNFEYKDGKTVRLY